MCVHDTLSGSLGDVLKSKKWFRKLTAEQGFWKALQRRVLGVGLNGRVGEGGRAHVALSVGWEEHVEAALRLVADEQHLALPHACDSETLEVIDVGLFHQLIDRGGCG